MRTGCVLGPLVEVKTSGGPGAGGAGADDLRLGPNPREWGWDEKAEAEYLIYENGYGGAGDDDRLDAGSGDDEIFGDEGDDVMRGGTGGDTLSGGAGNDTAFGDSGDDSLPGGSGTDTVDYSGSIPEEGSWTENALPVRVDLQRQRATGVGLDTCRASKA